MESLKLEKLNKYRLLSFKTAFHVAVLAHHILVVASLFRLQLEGHQDKRVTGLIPYRFFTLTGWMFSFQISFLVFALSVDIDAWCGRAPANLWVRDLIFCGLVFPFTLAVAGLFWPLYWWDRDVIYPVVWDTVVPPWVNQGVHGLTVLVAVAELVLEPRTPPDNRGSHLALHWFFSVGYVAIIYGVYVVDGVWLYPFLGNLSWPQLCLFQTCFSASGQLYYELQWLLTAFIRNTNIHDNILLKM